MSASATSAKEFIRANRTFFLFVGILLVTLFGYFWWRSGFTLDFSRFFAACSDGDCDEDGALNPAVPGGNDCNDSDPNVQGNCPLALCCDVDPANCQSACQGNENQNNCPSDCGSPGPTCGDGTCEGGENSNNCPDDCGGGGPVCGDGTCEGGENQNNCSDDCGNPPPTCTADCNSGDCDGDCALNPAVVGGNDCNDSDPNVQGNCPLALCCDVSPPGQCQSACQGNENQNNCPSDCGSPPPPVNTCVQGGNVCIANYPGGGCPPSTNPAAGDCLGGGACCRPVSQPGETTATLNVSPDSVPAGGTVNISWNSTNATSCRVLAGNFGPIGLSGNATEAINAVPGQTVGFRIACTGANGEVESNVEDVFINSDPPDNQRAACDPVNLICGMVEGSGADTDGCTAGTVGQPCQVAKHLGCLNSTCQMLDGGGQATDGCNTLGQACTPPTGEGICAGNSDRWGSDGVVVCRISSNFVRDRCTIAGPGTGMTYTLGIYNGSNTGIYSRAAIFYCPWATCGAVDHNSSNPPNWPQGSCSFGNASWNVSGDTNIGSMQSGTVTYSFNSPDCGTIQFDDTWGPLNVFVIGNVVNSDNNCPVSQSHLSCQNNTCTRVSGAGGDECSPEGSSCGGNPTHLECVNNACTTVSGGGADTCSGEGSSCGTTPTHLECVNNTCTSVAGAGTNACSPVGSACGVVETHLVCANNACVSVNGPGADTCATNTDCAPPPSGLRCVGTVSEADIGELVSFSATGGTGSYSWFAPGGAPGTGGGTPFSTAYSSAGFKTVTVVSGGDQATCVVTIITPPTNQFVCAPLSQDIVSGASATVTATGGTPNYTWSAPDGNPASQRDGTSFTSIFTNTTQPSRTFPITVTDSAGRNAVCNVNVSCPVADCPAPPEGCTYEGGNLCTCGTLVCPSDNPLVCAPALQTVEVDELAEFQAAGGTTRTFSWSAPDGNPSSASGADSDFATRYDDEGTYRVTVTAGNQTASCTVVVREEDEDRHMECRSNSCVSVSGGGRDECDSNSDCRSPTSPALTIRKVVRNVTTNGPEQEVANASPANTVEFTINVSSVGSGTANNVVVRDTLPNGLTYQNGTTTVDGSPAADGIIGSGLPLGNMSPGRTITVRFRATVAPESFFAVGTTTLVNIAYARGSNTSEVSDTAVVVVTRSGTGVTIAITKFGRNVTRNQTGEHSPVYADPAQTIEFIIHVRNTGPAALSNVMVRDVLPPAITFVAGTVRVNGQPAADTLVTSGINIGTLAVGAQATITFSGRIAEAAALPIGTSTHINAAYTRADGTPEVVAQLPVIVLRAGPPVTQVPTGPGESTVLALIISAVITLLYVGYTSTDTYRRREAGSLAGQAGKDPDLMDFKR